MHHDAGPPHWKSIKIQKNAKGPRTTGQTDGWMDGYIILPLRGFEPVACSRMCCAQLWATQMIAKKQCRRPDSETEIQTYKLNCTPLGSYGPQYGDNNIKEGSYIITTTTDILGCGFNLLKQHNVCSGNFFLPHFFSLKKGKKGKKKIT